MTGRSNRQAKDSGGPSLHVRLSSPAAKESITIAAAREGRKPSAWVRWIVERVAAGDAIILDRTHRAAG